MSGGNAGRGSGGGSVPPVVVVLATGGTIAGQACRAGSTVEYRAGTLGVECLLEAVPGLFGVARLRGEQIANVGSQHMTEAIWLRLAAAAGRALADPGVDGVVVLHGTDTLEETAYFLDLVVGGAKPVVVTGAMRPADAPSADGPMNILNAVRLAGNAGARGLGVLVALNDRIHAARDVVKSDTLDLAAFQSAGGGMLGRLVDGRPLFRRRPADRSAGPVFRLAGLTALPRVEIIYGHAGQRRDLVDAAVAAGASGLVHAGVGMGHVHQAVRAAFVEAMRRGVRVVCSTRVPDGPVSLDGDYLGEGFIAAGDLNPQKARVLLQLALTRTDDIGEIRGMFEEN